MVKRMASMNTRLNIEKLDGNIVQKHGGSKQVGFKQLGPGVETGVHGVSNDVTAVAQRRLKDKQPEKKTNTDCLVKKQEKEYQTGWKIKTGNVLDSCNQRSTQQCMKSVVALGVAGIQQQNVLVDETNVTLFAKVCCFLIQSGLSKVFWAEDTTRNMGFNECGEYKKTFIGSGVGPGSMQVFQGVEFEDLIYYHPTRDREQHSAWELFSYKEDSNEAVVAVATVDKIYAHESLTFNNTVACEVEILATKGLLDKVKGNVLGMEIVRDQSGNTLRVSQSRFYNGKLVQTLLEGHSILSLEGCLSGDCDVEKNGMLDKFDRGLQTDIQVFVDFDYDMALSTTEAGYMTFTNAWKKEIWLKGLLTKLIYELRLVAGIATGALVKGGSRSEVPA
ncbi:hypothetical protein Tco_0524877 [Tanacetum coccineum]